MGKFTVVIPTLNEEGVVGNLLEDIQRQTKKPLETIVVDANSEDKTIEEAKFYGAIVIESRPPVGYQRQLGGKKAKGDVIFFIDADCRLGRNFFEKFLKEFRSRKLDIACPIFWPKGSSIDVKALVLLLDGTFVATQNLYPSGGGPCMVIKRSTFEKSNGFNEKCTFDDIEFVSRVGKKNKYGIVREPIYISDRRFKKYGFFKTCGQFAQISKAHITGHLNDSNHIEYKFGEYQRIKKDH